MTPNLPSRWQEILRREAAANVGVVLAQARETKRPQRVPRWIVPTGLVIAGSAFAFALSDTRRPRGATAVPFDRSTVISTRTAGLGASAADLAPRPTPAPVPTPGPVPEPSTPATEEAKSTRPERRLLREDPAPASGAPSRPPPCRGCDTRRRLLADVVTPTPEPVPVPAVAEPTPTPKPPAPVVNVGTRMPAVVTEPVVTGIALAPVTARLAQDVTVGPTVVIPSGATLVGDAFSTQEGDRVQVVFSAVVVNGRTVRLEGWGLQDGEMGLRGKVLRKASKKKRSSAALLGAAATGLAYGTSGVVPGAAGAALSSLGSSVGSDVDGLSREWRRSDKVVRVEAGVPVTVYLRRDLTME